MREDKKVHGKKDIQFYLWKVGRSEIRDCDIKQICMENLGNGISYDLDFLFGE